MLSNKFASKITLTVCVIAKCEGGGFHRISAYTSRCEELICSEYRVMVAVDIKSILSLSSFRASQQSSQSRFRVPAIPTPSNPKHAKYPREKVIVHWISFPCPNVHNHQRFVKKGFSSQSILGHKEIYAWPNDVHLREVVKKTFFLWSG